MAWTSEHESSVARQWATGKSAAVIAKILNDKFGTTYSRNAVIGKIHRLGLAGRETPARPSMTRKAKPALPSKRRHIIKALPRKKITPQAPRPPKPKTAVVNAKAINDGRGVTLLDLENGQCRFPINEAPDGRSSDFRFCGRPQDPNAPKHAGKYCSDHLAITTTAPRTYGEIAATRLPKPQYIPARYSKA